MIDILTELFSPIQLVGYAGMICGFLSFQCKKSGTLFALQAACSSFFALQFFLLGGWSGFFLNICAIARGLVLGLGERCRRWYFLAAVQAAFVASLALSVFVFCEPWWIATLLFIAQAGGMLVMWTRDGKWIRVAQLSFISPIWILHNTVYKFSAGGLFCEVFNVCSVVVSFIRFRKTGFDKK